MSAREEAPETGASLTRAREVMTGDGTHGVIAVREDVMTTAAAAIGFVAGAGGIGAAICKALACQPGDILGFEAGQ